MDCADNSKLNVSLEPHLLQVLSPLPSLLSPTLADELNNYISDAPKDVIPYSTLFAVSKWARTPEGQENLKNHIPSLDINSYTMVSLLAGVKTSPERNFGMYTPPQDPDELAEQQKRERKEITAIINALLSVFGVGFATWWAADTLHWKHQWRVLLAVASSLIVAIAESGLFIFWRLRQDAPKARPKYRVKTLATRHKKTDEDTNAADETHVNIAPQQLSEQSTLPSSSLRQRRL